MTEEQSRLQAMSDAELEELEDDLERWIDQIDGELRRRTQARERQVQEDARHSRKALISGVRIAGWTLIGTVVSSAVPPAAIAFAAIVAADAAYGAYHAAKALPKSEPLPVRQLAGRAEPFGLLRSGNEMAEAEAQDYAFEPTAELERSRKILEGCLRKQIPREWRRRIRYR